MGDQTSLVDSASEKKPTASRSAVEDQSRSASDQDQAGQTPDIAKESSEKLLYEAGATAITPRKEVDKTQAFHFVPGRKEIIPEQPTVAFIDDFKYNVLSFKGAHGFSHGELSARLAEENNPNANVMRFQINRDKTGAIRMDHALAELDKAIEEGQVKLGKGDFLNLSFGLTSRFDATSDLLKMEITPENVAEKREEILAAMKAALSRDDISSERRTFLEDAIGINEGIKKLQERGIKVIGAAGNDGPEYLNTGFIFVDKMYSALTRGGELADYSGKNSLTTDGRGQIDFYYQAIDLIDKESIKKQSGSYALDGSSVVLPAKEFGGLLTKTASRNVAFGLLTSIEQTGTLPKPFSKLNDGGYGTSFNGYSRFDLNKGLVLNFTRLEAHSIVPDFKTWRRAKGPDAHGSSYVNVFMLPKEIQMANQK